MQLHIFFEIKFKISHIIAKRAHETRFSASRGEAIRTNKTFLSQARKARSFATYVISHALEGKAETAVGLCPPGRGRGEVTAPPHLK
jgi:hypothetical protein